VFLCSKVFGHHYACLKNDEEKFGIVWPLYKAEEVYVEAQKRNPSGNYKANLRKSVSIRPWYQPSDPYFPAAIRNRHMSRIPYLISFPLPT